MHTNVNSRGLTTIKEKLVTQQMRPSSRIFTKRSAGRPERLVDVTYVRRRRTCEASSNSFWGFIKSLKQDSFGICTLKDQGELISNNTKEDEVLNHQFRKVFTLEDTTTLPHVDGDPYPAMPEIQVTVPGVENYSPNSNPRKLLVQTIYHLASSKSTLLRLLQPSPVSCKNLLPHECFLKTGGVLTLVLFSRREIVQRLLTTILSL